MLGTKPKTSHALGKHSASELYPQILTHLFVYRQGLIM